MVLTYKVFSPFTTTLVAKFILIYYPSTTVTLPEVSTLNTNVIVVDPFGTVIEKVLVPLEGFVNVTPFI